MNAEVMGTRAKAKQERGPNCRGLDGPVVLVLSDVWLTRKAMLAPGLQTSDHALGRDHLSWHKVITILLTTCPVLYVIKTNLF